MTIRNCWAQLIPVLWCSAASIAFGAESPLETAARTYREKPSPVLRDVVASFAKQSNQQGALALLNLGITEYDQKQYSEAIRDLTACRSRLPSLADHTAYYLAASYAAQQQYANALSALAPLWTHAPPSNLLGKGAVLAARSYAAAGQPASGVKTLRNYESELPQPLGWLTLAKVSEAAGDFVPAAAAFQKAYYEYPGTPEADEAGPALARLQTQLGGAYPPPMPQTMLARAAKLLPKSPGLAKGEYENLMTSLAGAERDIARVRIGVAEYNAHQYAKALPYLKSFNVNTPEADAERLHYLVQSARRLDNASEMAAALDALGRRYPTSPWRVEALIDAAYPHLLENRHAAYEPLYRACFESFPNEPRAAFCHWRYAWSAYLRRRGESGDLMRDHLRRYPASEKGNAAIYFLGRLAEQQGDRDAAKTYYLEDVRRFPNSYYAVLSRQRLGDSVLIRAGDSEQVRQFIASIRFPAPPPDINPQPNSQTQARIEHARLLEAAGLADLAEAELRYGPKAGAQSFVLAAELSSMLHRHGQADRGIRILKNMTPGYLNYPLEVAGDAFWRLAFPMPFRKALESNAAERGLDPFLMAGLVRQESEFNPKVRSVANAYGLTQILPGTGRELSRYVGVARFSPAMLTQPEVNIRLGAYYVRMLLNGLNNHMEATLASYNAGRTRAVKWLAFENYREPAEFVETIPFNETRDYVQAVIRNGSVYRRLYEGRPIEVTSTDEYARQQPAPPVSKPAATKKSAAKVSQRKNR